MPSFYHMETVAAQTTITWGPSLRASLWAKSMGQHQSTTTAFHLQNIQPLQYPNENRDRKQRPKDPSPKRPKQQYSKTFNHWRLIIRLHVKEDLHLNLD